MKYIWLTLLLAMCVQAQVYDTFHADSMQWQTTITKRVHDDYVPAHYFDLRFDIFSRQRIKNVIDRCKFTYPHSYLFKSYKIGLQHYWTEKQPKISNALYMAGGFAIGYIMRDDPVLAVVTIIGTYALAEALRIEL